MSVSKNIDLSTMINGILFENPFVLASAPPTATNESIRKAFDEGWAGVVVKTVRPDSVINSNVTPRFAALKHNKNVIGFQNIEMLSEKSIHYWEETITSLRKDYPNKVVIASVMGSDEDSWKEVSIRMCDCGSHALELNFSCPNGVTQQGLGLSIGQDLESIQRITSWVKEVSTVPIIVKLTPNVTDIASAAKAAVEGGAEGIAAINTVSCLLGVDIDTLSPLPSVNGNSTYGGYSGIAVKPIGLRCVAQIGKAVNVPVYGMGGVSTWKDAVEYIALGSGVVQVCTEVMINGFSIVKKMIEGLSEYMIVKGFNSIDDFRGVALNKIVQHNELSREYKAVARIDKEKCVNCLKCLNICTESGYEAIYKNNNKMEVSANKCDGCSLCTYVCSVNAITMTDGGKQKCY